MMRFFCKSKIQGLVVTRTDLNYPGSITVDSKLAQAAELCPYEMVQVLNLANGARIETYYIPGESGKKEICLNGASARWFEPGDKIIILSTALYKTEETAGFKPRIIITNERNEIVEQR